MKDNFKKAAKVLKTNAPGTGKVIFVNGCCYGRENQPDKGDYLKYCGQIFWHFISGQENLYTDIIEPLGYKAKEKNEVFFKEYSKTLNSFTAVFLENYCNEGAIDWDLIVAYNSAKIRPGKKKAIKKK